MAMQNSDELRELIGTVFTELTKLDIVLTRCLIMIYDPRSNDSVWWMASSEAPTEPIGLRIQNHGHPPYVAYLKAWQEKKLNWVYVLEGAVKKDWDNFLFVETELSHLPDFVITGMKAPERVYLNSSFNSFGNLTLATLEPLSNEHFDILLRFAKVFDLTYTRFNDLKQAEAQAKEAKIEAALERVRARSMGMQKSDELAEVVSVLYKQFQELDFGLYQVLVSIYDRKKKTIEWWSRGFGTDNLPQCNKIPIIDHPFCNDLLNRWENGEEYYAHTLEGEMKDSWEDYLFTKTDLQHFPQEVKDTMRGFEKVYLADVFMKYGSLQAAGPAPLPDDKAEILKRFVKVLDHAYTRMTDLQNAEAQAKEARIQLALERVRARTMAMQKSNELAEAAKLLYEEFRTLAINTFLCGYCFYKEEQDKQTVWVTTPDGAIIPDFVDFPMKGDHVLDKRYEDWKQKKQLHVLEIQGEVNKEHHRFLASRVPDQVANEIFARIPDRIIFYCANFSAGYLFIIATESLTPDEEEVIIRFAKVFELTYTRFLDLQKAEAQAREAQIQLAMERVRARTMAMQRSEELAEVATVLFQQVKALGVSQWVCGFGIWEIGDKEFTWYPGSPDGQILAPCKVPLTEHPVFISIDESRRRGDELFVYEKKGEFQADHYRYMMSVPGMREQVQKILDAGLSIPSFQIDHIANFSHGNLIFITYEHFPEMHDIFKRFAKVFEQTYTRFLDLQKAEAQAREGQIEAALERVRSKTMAMQRSEELDTVIKTVYSELKRLDVSFERCFIMIFDEQKGATWWMGSPDDNLFNQGFYVQYHTHPPHLAYLKGWEEREQKWEYLLAGQIKKDWDEFIFNKTELSQLPPPVIQHMSSFDHAYLAASFESFGCMTTGGVETLNEESFNILNRFAKVFDQTYRRFLDLQKAEAQAREAQIEAALEKVRSRSLAMHKAEELGEVITVIFDKLKELDFSVADGVALVTFIEGSKDLNEWMANPGFPSAIKFYLPYFDHPILSNFWNAKNQGTDFVEGRYTAEENRSFLEHIFEQSDYKNTPQEIKNFCLAADFYANSIAFQKNTAIFINDYAGHSLSEHEIDILKRFSKVFEQAYIRFMDLQKAESQAREAQIEAALERFRAKAMAMHNSEDLNETIKVFYRQLETLNLMPRRCGVGLIDKAMQSTPVAELIGMVINEQGEAKEIAGKLKLSGHAVLENIYNGWLHQQDYHPILRGNEIKEYYRFISSNISTQNYPEDAVQFGYFFFFPEGTVYAWTEKEFTEDELKIYRRFTSVLSLTYKRYNDLKQAEAQANEARIEIALERIRARALAMHKSDELMEVTKVMREQMALLGQPELEASVVHLYEQDPDHILSWRAFRATDSHGKVAYGHMAIPKNSCEAVREWLRNFYSELKEYTIEMSGAKQVEWYDVMSKLAPEVIDSMRREKSLHEKRYYRFSKFSGGALLMVSKQEPSVEAAYLQGRAAVVFDLAYRRFSDLQKAEAQAREAQIEVSLERVRAKAMAMHSSKDLSETLTVFYRELKSLGVVPRRCGIALISSHDRMAEVTTMNTTEQGDSIEVIGYIKMSGHKILDEVYENWRIQKEYRAVLRGNEIKEYYQVIRPQISVPDYPNDVVQYGYYFMFKEGDVYTWTEKELTEDELKIYRRFTTVISLTYKRYKDLQQAEAQAKEAQIETGLERVRARTMAMHSSEDVSIATATMFRELEKLNIQNFRGGILNIRSDQTMEVWSINTSDDGTIIRAIGNFDMKMHPLWQQLFKTWMNKEEFLRYEMSGKEEEEYIKIMDGRRDYLPNGLPHLPDCIVHSYLFGEGAVWTYSLQPHSDEDKQIMKRFTAVFSLTFRRYMDLQKAEAQAREATIEAALERVRGKAMAMHSSRDLATTIGVFYHELEGLDLTPRRCGVGLIDKEKQTAEISTMNATADGEGIELVGNLDLRSHPVLTGVYNHWLTKTEYHPVLRGNEIKEYYQLVRPQIAFPDFPNDTVQYGYFFFFEEGGVYAWTEKELNEDELKIYRRFTSVLSLTYKRYKDLKDAEARAHNAIKEAALDRIRADIASMRTINDLDRITPLIWNELTVLGIPFIRCGVFIMDEDQQLIHTFLSTPDGKAIAAFHLPYDTPGNLSHVIGNWKAKKKYIDHWDESEFTQFAEILVRQGTLASAEQYLRTIPKGGFHLHFLPFLQGMLYVGNTTQLNNEEIELIQHVADAFSTAYARYEDFNKLEAAKQQVDKTLTDLKQAQQQLVQSEKMASLGELTAGIAHEIQNPLNFVNNFSDVSNELLEEMKIELEKGNKEDAIAIVEDVKQNLEKILHHGKRADAIVKGMLQHSRTSSGQKEPTDVNILADEYLRLAFHGLRAKDKSFNAKFETAFDASLEKINIIPQEIGRVILNLINNAFYAVTEKKKHVSAGSASNGYEPTVTVTTKKENGKVEIKVKDNGNGIPQKVQDKIFQPFFTTKPTGQGTGLGLSLSYDIVKAHGGELKMETKESEGSEFTIQIPII